MRYHPGTGIIGGQPRPRLITPYGLQLISHNISSPFLHSTIIIRSTCPQAVAFNASGSTTRPLHIHFLTFWRKLYVSPMQTLVPRTWLTSNRKLDCPSRCALNSEHAFYLANDWLLNSLAMQIGGLFVSLLYPSMQLLPCFCGMSDTFGLPDQVAMGR